MVNAIATITTNAWVKATWEDFSALAEGSVLEDRDKKFKFYYDNGWMRIEDMSIGSAHGQDNSILAAVISLYGTVKDLNYISFTGSNFQKVGERECQPDLAYYIDPRVQRPPKNNQPVDVNRFGPPTLAIEISASTLDSDLGSKRLLYERLGIQEYWVVNVEEAKVVAFAMANGGSREIRTSLVLPELAMTTIEEALQRSQTEDDGAINRWLFKQFS